MNDSSGPALADGTKLLADRYRLEELVGRGGMADVYRGTDTRLGRTVAIKLLKTDLAIDPAFRVRFRQEAQAAARMAHPTIVRVFDAGEETVKDDRGIDLQQPFIVMEYVEGTLLRDLINRGPLELGEAARIVGGILTALEYSHRAGVVHRDIKPGNVMITATGGVKVMDFRIARAVSDGSATVAQTTAIIGTASYFSPEQARGESVDARTDLYSAGVVLFEALTGRPPFRGETAVAVAYQHVSESPVAPSSLNPKVSPAFNVVVEKALRKDRFSRYQTAAEFRRDLETAAAGKIPTTEPDDSFAETLFGPAPVVPTATEAALRAVSEEATVRTQQRPPVVWIWAGIATVAVIVIAIVVWVMLQASAGGEQAATSAKVPDIVGVSFEDATAQLDELGIRWDRGVDEYSTEVDKDHVIRTEPVEGTVVSLKADIITIIVSLGEAPVGVPDIRDLSLEDATAALTEAGFDVGSISKQNSPTVKADHIIDTSPQIGVEAERGATINLIVSTGMVELPYVTGQSVDVAAGILGSDNLQLAVDMQPNPTCPASPGAAIVQSQSMAPGDVPQGSTITLRYCTGGLTPTPGGDDGEGGGGEGEGE